ncbi:MAG: DUF5020 family protein [Candidatus Neomarinimicrobiota bacterium]
MKLSRISLLALIMSASPTRGQNLQIHYDLGEDREYLTSTLEMFKPDSSGSTYFFVDFDYDAGNTGSASLAYWEFIRYFHVAALPGLSWTIQFNDGVAPWGPLGDVWLAGLSYPLNLGIITLSTELLYRRARFSDGPDLQFTAVWFRPFMEGRFTFSGFLDVWTAQLADAGREIVVLVEPQLWYRLWPTISLGSELEVSRNFLPDDGWLFKPTVAVKWFF